MARLEIRMGIPMSSAGVVAMVDLDEADALFDESPGGEHLLAEDFGFGLIKTIHLLRVGGLLIETDDLGDGGLHAKREFIGLHPGADGVVVGVGIGGEAVEFTQQFELRRLFGGIEIGLGLGVVEGRFGIDAEGDSVELGTQVIGAVGFLAAATISERCSHDDKLGKVFVEGAETIVRPSADRGEEALDAVAAGMELKLRAMVAVLGPHRTDDGEIVGGFGDVRPPVGDFEPALPMFSKTDLQGVNGVAQESVIGIKGDDTFVGEIRGVENRFVGGVGDRLASVFVEKGLGIEGFQMAGAADHEEPDHALGAGREVREGGVRFGESVLAQHRRKREAAEAETHFREKRTACLHGPFGPPR